MPLREYEPGTSHKPRPETFVDDCQRRATELQQAHAEWKISSTEPDKQGFSSAWLRAHNYTGLAKWIYNYNALSDVLALCPAEVGTDIERRLALTPEIIQTRFMAAHNQWKKNGSGSTFDRPWLREHDSNLDKYVSDNDLWDQVIAALPDTIRADFKYVVPPPEYTLDSAIAKFRSAYAAWSKLPADGRPTFTGEWLRNNGFSGVERYLRDHWKDFSMIAHLAGADIGRDFKNRVNNTEQIVLDKLRQAYYEWANEDKATRGKLNTAWLRKHRYMHIYAWARQNYPGGFTSLLEKLPPFMRADLKE